jgi:hypothetical protein
VYGYSSASLQGKSFRKAVSAVMDDLELFNSIIEQLTPVNAILLNLCSKLVPLHQKLLIKFVNRVSAFAIASSLGTEEVTCRQGYVCII